MIRWLLDVLLYLSHHMVLAFLFFSGLAFMLHIVFRNREPLYQFLNKHIRLIAITWGLGLFAIFLAIGGWYLTLPGFAGEVEPLVSSVSWLVQKGEPIYHALDAAGRYSLLYGPSVFLTNGLFLELLGPSLFSVKLASFLASVFSLIFLYAALARRKLDATALCITGLATLYYWMQGFSVYLVRPDSLILFSVSFGLLAAVRARRILACLGVAAAIGFGLNLKIHAGLYFLPILGIMLDRWGWRWTFATAFGAMLVLLAPFVFYSQVSLPNYIHWLENAARHGLTTVTLTMTVRYAVFLVLPLIAFRISGLWRNDFLAAHKNFSFFLVPAVLLAVLFSNKPGAGLVHLLPLVPTVLYLTGLVARKIGPALRFEPLPRFGAGLIFAVLIAAFLAGSAREYQTVRFVSATNRGSGDLCIDLEEIMARYDDLKIVMACGGEASNFQITWLRPLLVFQDNPLFLDPVSVMDCCLSGQKISDETYVAMAAGEVDLWLVPRQKAPFVKQNWYPPHDPLFSDEFISKFHENYTLEGNSRYFDLWFWDGLDGTQRAAVPPSGSGDLINASLAH